MFKLGRKAPKALGPHLKFGRFLRGDAPPPPPEHGNWVKTGSPGIYRAMADIEGNDQYGDCTCAAAAHMLAVFCSNTESEWLIPVRSQTLAFYARVTNPPFDPATGVNDNGADEVTVLNVWAKDGFYGGGWGKIAAWATVDAANAEEVRQAIYMFGNVYFGVPMPDAWIHPFPSASGFVWGNAGDPNPANGHAFPGYGYNAEGVFIDTWGMFGTVTWEALAKYCAPSAGGELYTVLSPDWQAKAPNGLASAELAAYIKTLFG